MSSLAPSSAFLAAFRTRLAGRTALPFAEFMDLALYHPAVGYYRQSRARVGYGRGTDFYTASTSGPLFGELVAAACVALLGKRDPAQHAFVEIGAEGAGGVLAGVPHPFRSSRIVRIGEEMDLAGDCIVFSNELFDAQPFRRYARRGGAWRELGVALQDDTLVGIELPGDGTHPLLPSSAAEGHILDAPLASVSLLDRIARQPWSGLFLAFDYGHTLAGLLDSFPQGTARAYRRHVQSNDLLASPGDQDLTCHVCWDWLIDVLRRHGFEAPAVESQESFLIRHAASAISATVASEADRFSPRKLALQQLLHPAHLGQKFQALGALRPSRPVA